MTFAPKYALTYKASIPQQPMHMPSQHNRLYSTSSNWSAAIVIVHVQRLAHTGLELPTIKVTAGSTKVAVKRDRWPKRLAH